MRVNNNQNSPSFQAKIGGVEAKKILEKFGKETLDEIVALAPRIIKDEENFGDKSYKYFFEINAIGNFQVTCEKLFVRKYPEAKTKIGKILTGIKKAWTSEYASRSTSKNLDSVLTTEGLAITAKRFLAESRTAKSFEEKDRLLAFNSKLKEITK